MSPKILIVDDMPDAIDFLPEWFKHEGYETLIATRGQQALALAEEAHPDVILLDVMMPGMDGIETCRRLRRNPATSNIPVILVSARSPSEARAEGLLAGATDYITKPIHFPDLLERVERLVHLHDEMSPDHRRLLEEMVYTALAVLPCSLAWLLIVDSEMRWLVSQALATDRGADASRLFLSMMQGNQKDARWPLEHSSNPLSEVVLNRTVLINLAAEKFQDLTGGALFHRAFTQFRFAYITILPLVISGKAVGALVLATKDTQLTDSRRAQQILNSLSNQAATVVDNARLLADLASREAQMRAEQTLRQMVLDTMGEGLVVVDEEARIIYVNNRLLLLTGHLRNDLYGQNVGMIFHPATREQVVNSLTGERRKTLSFSQTLFAKNGKEVPVLLSRAVTPSPDGRGNITVIVLTDLTELQRHEEALKLQTQRLQAINHAVNAMSSASSLQEVIQISLDAVLQVVPGVSASMLLRDPAQLDRLVLAASVGPQNGELNNRAVMKGQGLAGWVANTARSQLVPDLTVDSQIRTEYTALYGADLRSVAAIPLLAFDEVIGVLEVISKNKQALNEHDLETLESLAGSAAITVENARLFEQERRRVTELSTLLDASAAVTTTLDFGDILERIARRLSVALQVERVVITDWNNPARQLVTLAEIVNAYWLPDQGPLRPLENMPVTCSVVNTGTLVKIVTPRPGDPPLLAAEYNPCGLRAVVVFPLVIQKQLAGMVALYHETPQGKIPEVRVDAVNDAVLRWQQGIESFDPKEWHSRSNLTDLCQQVLQASGLRWCAVMQWNVERSEIRVLREIGRALWLGEAQQVWPINHFPHLARVLEMGELLTLQRDQLPNDPHEQTYLQAVGGTTCLVAPLFIRGEAGGVVKLIDTKPERREFDNAELSLCQGIANVVGNAMDNAQLYAAQERRASELEAAYKQLQESDQTKEDLLQNISHEFRTPLTHILGYLRLTLDEAFGPLTKEQVENLNLVTDKAQHLVDLVRDIIRVQESDARNLILKPIHLERVLALTVRSMAPKAQTKGIRIVPRIPANLPPAYADPARVGEVFEELLENAIKFSSGPSQVEITLEDNGGLMIHASVRDHGIGIDQDEHEKIFRRFYQVDRGTARRYGGSGLGLAIVRQVVEGHSGRVWVESEPGKGTCFHLLLPKATTMEGSG
ncbi:MAG: GAF domain-containing protein [Chloroflexi bacterium]|nr:GAF domain-containing protein [Chloroflexota bacterium]